MEDAGFILGSYALVFGVVAAYSWRVLRSARRAARRVADAEKYWT